MLSIEGVLGPDEHDDNVTDSAYTNAAAAAAIEFAVESSAALGITPDPLSATLLVVPEPDKRNRVAPHLAQSCRLGVWTLNTVGLRRPRTARARTVLGWPKICELAHAFLW
jgi:hypothetical protein